ncbi:hypothetical protein E8E12_001952 [Didymella heteroderae]|uniref:Uncharacterized protein n=1 Tax=Didymella heteroderae TaxID=1769908 RepID=A0A9P5BVQ9_9PLEO|nr:hypothetical protein E8E12_001952 [Didymella heteroderae]
MPPKRSLEATKEADNPFKRAQRTRKPTFKKREGDGSQPTQPTEPPTEVPEYTPEPVEPRESTPEPPESTPEPPESTPEPPESTPEPPIEPPTQPAGGAPSARITTAYTPSLTGFSSHRSAWELQLVANKPPTATVQPRPFSSAATEVSVEEETAPPIKGNLILSPLLCIYISIRAKRFRWPRGY